MSVLKGSHLLLGVVNDIADTVKMYTSTYIHTTCSEKDDPLALPRAKWRTRQATVRRDDMDMIKTQPQEVPSATRRPSAENSALTRRPPEAGTLRSAAAKVWIHLKARRFHKLSELSLRDDQACQ